MRILLAVVIAVSVAPLVTAHATPPRTAGAWGSAFAAEAVVGAGLGLVAGLVVEAARQGGEIVASAAGLSTASFFDPETGGESTPLGRLYGLTALVVFIALDGPPAVVGVLVESYQAAPLGQVVAAEATAAFVFAQIQLALGLALRVAAPTTVALMLAGLTIGWIGRVGAGATASSTAWSARLVVGLGLTMIGLSTLAATLGDGWREALLGLN